MRAPFGAHPEWRVAPTVPLSQDPLAGTLVLCSIESPDDSTIDTACLAQALKLFQASIHGFVARRNEKDWLALGDTKGDAACELLGIATSWGVVDQKDASWDPR